MKLSINNRYMALQGLYWMMFCAASGFISLYLQGRGLSSAGIGNVTAAFGMMAALLQHVLGRITDRDSRVTWRGMILSLTFPFLLVCLVMPLVKGTWSGALFMGLLILLSNTIMPFLNTAHFEYSRSGEFINFGVARGIGSGLYALGALLIGFLAEKFGIEVVPFSGAVISVIFIAVVLRMPVTREIKPAKSEEKSHQKGFLRRYPAFAVMLLACLLMLTAHIILNTYLLQIIQSRGGESSQLGIALAAQAVVEVPVLFGFNKLHKRFSASSLMLTAAVGFSLKALLFALSSSVEMIYLIQCTQMISFALFASASVFYTSESIAKEEQTTGQAYMTSMIAAGSVLGSLIGGWVLELFGMSTMLFVNFLIAVLGVVFALISVRSKKLLLKA